MTRTNESGMPAEKQRQDKKIVCPTVCPVKHSQTVWCVTFHRAVWNSPHHLWPAEIDGKGKDEEWTAPELEKHNDFLWPVSQKLSLLYALKDLMFCAGILPIYWLNQYCVWVKEISHQDCIHHGLINTNNTSPTVFPERWNWTQTKKKVIMSKVYVSCRPGEKEIILLDRFLKNLFFPHTALYVKSFFPPPMT